MLSSCAAPWSTSRLTRITSKHDLCRWMVFVSPGTETRVGPPNPRPNSLNMARCVCGLGSARLTRLITAQYIVYSCNPSRTAMRAVLGAPASKRRTPPPLGRSKANHAPSADICVAQATDATLSAIDLPSKSPSLHRCPCPRPCPPLH